MELENVSRAILTESILPHHRLPDESHDPLHSRHGRASVRDRIEAEDREDHILLGGRPMFTVFPCLDAAGPDLRIAFAQYARQMDPSLGEALDCIAFCIEIERCLGHDCISSSLVSGEAWLLIWFLFAQASSV